jgi:cytochrome c556
VYPDPEDSVHSSARRWGAAGALAAAALLGAPRETAAQGRTASEAPQVAYRKAVMDGLVAHVVALRVLLTSNIGHADDVRKHAAALNAGATMFDDLFFARATGGTSNAREEIWRSSDDFRRRTQEFQDAVRMLDQEVARNPGAAELMPRLQMVVGTCTGCHTAFKLPAALPF